MKTQGLGDVQKGKYRLKGLMISPHDKRVFGDPGVSFGRYMVSSQRGNPPHASVASRPSRHAAVLSNSRAFGRGPNAEESITLSIISK
jgi:hypothetical protein